ncbi:hypothetical protein CNEO4_460002 [Clostridium neonatale]|uniref:Uncharacterized protein n=1 Tax=Clostridium neonatale TaxID=137838 RepID=A0AAD2DDP2_9CLOT|nr:hypothetical protein CNEO_1850004 [Clostridium neonatale]CAI3195241.1 hypothetical protein CNEO2_1500002 [Clostridium neonatale]CAI3196614.1 hypothetical protein CNEO2_1570002 [Clostridium neonatale]CAI3203122.1 hypothetical protein CNEO2_2320002 [Clostridium neonatale]CAI3545252.1 hypothetical protein CNEO4_260002 [Clostridium neonatale]
MNTIKIDKTKKSIDKIVQEIIDTININI